MGSGSAIRGGNITAEGGSAVTARGVVWANTENLTVLLDDGISQDGTGTGIYESTLTGLEPETQYFVRSYATNTSGTAYGQTFSFTMAEMLDELTDADGNVFEVVSIAGKLWMAENLKTTNYNEGIEIQNITEEVAWTHASAEAYAWYENNQGNAATYGALYNWRAVETAKLCPAGWRLATDEDWKQLEGTVDSQYDLAHAEWDGTGYRGHDAGDQLKASSGWSETGNTNEDRLSALPGGTRGLAGPFFFMGISGKWWTGTLDEEEKAWARDILSGGGRVRRSAAPLNNGASIRCVMGD